MSVLEGVLKEELERLESNVLEMNKKLDNLPRGTIYIAKIYNSYFVYRKRKENGKVVSTYIGPLNDKNTEIEIEKSKDYKRLKQLISSGNKEIVKLRKALKAYE